MSFYKRHIFFCTNQKVDGKKCCAQFDAIKYADYMKSELKKINLHGAKQNRVSKSVCLGRCKVGPCIVIYPENIWYTYSDKKDIDEIISTHIIDGKISDRLLLDKQ
jgi:(2Fe-2S) ferredoxin